MVVNRVARARAVFERLKADFEQAIADGVVGEPLLLIGPARPCDRDEPVKYLEPIRTRTWTKGERRALDKPLILVSTQCIEAGVDIDLDALVTEAAPLDALRQRFGRLNRAGRDMAPYAAIVAVKSDLASAHDDPVYGKSIKPAWDRMNKAARKDGRHGIVDFGLNAFSIRIEDEMRAPKRLMLRYCFPHILIF